MPDIAVIPIISNNAREMHVDNDDTVYWINLNDEDVQLSDLPDIFTTSLPDSIIICGKDGENYHVAGPFVINSQAKGSFLYSSNIIEDGKFTVFSLNDTIDVP